MAPIVLLVAFLIFILHALYYWPWLEDDSFISFRYASNLIQGHGLVFNEGERVEGYSNFGWVLLASTALKMGLKPWIVAQVTGILGGIAALFLSWRLALKLEPRAGLAATVAPVFLAVNPLLARHAVTGLETVPYAALLIAALGLSVPRPDNRFNVAVPVLLLMLALLRPEGVAFALLVLVWRLAGYRVPRVFSKLWQVEDEVLEYRSSRSAGYEMVLFLVLYLMYFVWRWQYFDSLMPNTFYAKMSGGATALFDGLNYSLDFLRENGGVLVVGLFLANLLGPRISALFWPVATAITTQVVCVFLSGGDWMHFYRFYVPAMPLLAAAMAAGLGKILNSRFADRASDGGRLLSRRNVIIGMVLLAGFIGSYKTERAIGRLVMPSVKNGEYITDGFREASRWITENTADGSSVALGDIGLVGYLTGRRIIDMFGLIDPHIAGIPGRVHFKSDASYVLSRKPDTVILVASVDYEYLRIPDARLFASPEFRSRYSLVHTVEIGFQQENINIFRRHAQ